MVAEGKPVGVVMVAEESLAAITEFPEPVIQTVERIMILVRNYRSAEHFEPQKEIPDDAPTKVKNEIAAGHGKAFIIGVLMSDDTHLCMSWYEPNDRNMLFFWDIIWPANVEITDVPESL